MVIDIFESEKGFFVNEVNFNMEFKNVVRVIGVDMVGKLVEYVVEVVKI